LRGYDYSNAGIYFITLCLQKRLFLFGDIVNDQMQLSPAGKMILNVWDSMPETYERVLTDRFVIMPNHVHGIIALLSGERGPGPIPLERQWKTTQVPLPQPVSLHEVVKRFKMYTATLYRHAVRDAGWPPYAGRLWQRNYYEHIVRDGESLGKIRYYIANNPRRWLRDLENPRRVKEDPLDRWLGICRKD